MLTRGQQPGHLGSERHQRPDRHSPGQPLGEGDRVGDNVARLVGEPPTRATHPALDLVEDEQRACRRGQFAGQLQVCRAAEVDSRLTLDRFEDHRRQVVADLGDRGRQGSLVVERHVDDPTEQRCERLAIGEFPGQGEGPGRAAVEGALGGDDRPSAGAPRQLDGCLDRLGSGVCEEDTRARRGLGDPKQRLGQLDLRLAGEEV